MDSFAGLDGLGSKKNAPKSLAEQQAAAEQRKQNTWAALDMLNATSGSSVGPTGSPTDPFSSFAAPPAPKPVTKINTAASAQPAYNLQEPPKSVPTATRPHATKPLATEAAFEDDFADFVAPMETSSQSSEFRDDPDVLPSREQYTSSRSHSSRSTYSSQRSSRKTASASTAPASGRYSTSEEQQVSDRAVAQLLEMGFEPSDAKRALSAMNGSVSGAVSWLMAEAQGRPLPTPRSRGSDEWGEIGSVATAIGASVFAKASSLWSKGRREFNKAYEEYSGHGGGMGFSDDPRRSGDSFGSSSGGFKDEETPAGRGPYGGYSSEDYKRSRSTTPSHNGQEAPTASAPRAQSVVSNDEMPSRPPRRSRADLFREKRAQQQQRSSHQGSPAASVASRTSLVSSTEEISVKTVQNPAPAADLTPEIDLLNLSGSSQSGPVSSLGGVTADLVGSARKAGSESFARGDYEKSVSAYTEALSAAPADHPIRIVLLANRAAGELKTGDAKGALADCDMALSQLRGVGNSDIEPGKPATKLWPKLMARKAQASEQLERHADALDTYRQLLDGGYASSVYLDGKRRAQAALDKATQPESAEPPVSSKPKRRGWGMTGAVPTSVEGRAAVEKVKNEHRTQAAEMAKRDELTETVSVRVENWRAGKEQDLRALLASLETVLWPGSGWVAVSTSDLVVPKKVRVAYMKAVARTHPDKIPPTASLEHRMVAESVFVTIQLAWEKFRTENGL